MKRKIYRYIVLKKFEPVSHTDELEQIGVKESAFVIFYARSFKTRLEAKKAVSHHNKRFPKDKIKVHAICRTEWVEEV